MPRNLGTRSKCRRGSGDTFRRRQQTLTQIDFVRRLIPQEEDDELTPEFEEPYRPRKRTRILKEEPNGGGTQKNVVNKDLERTKLDTSNSAPNNIQEENLFGRHNDSRIRLGLTQTPPLLHSYEKPPSRSSFETLLSIAKAKTDRLDDSRSPLNEKDPNFQSAQVSISLTQRSKQSFRGKRVPSSVPSENEDTQTPWETPVLSWPKLSTHSSFDNLTEHWLSSQAEDHEEGAERFIESHANIGLSLSPVASALRKDTKPLPFMKVEISDSEDDGEDFELGLDYEIPRSSIEISEGKEGGEIEKSSEGVDKAIQLSPTISRGNHEIVYESVNTQQRPNNFPARRESSQFSANQQQFKPIQRKSMNGSNSQPLSQELRASIPKADSDSPPVLSFSDDEAIHAQLRASLLQITEKHTPSTVDRELTDCSFRTSRQEFKTQRLPDYGAQSSSVTIEGHIPSYSPHLPSSSQMGIANNDMDYEIGAFAGRTPWTESQLLPASLMNDSIPPPPSSTQ